MPEGHDIIVVGAFSGEIEALQRLLGELPGGLPAAVFVVVHIPEEAPSLLARILDRAGPLEARNPEDGEEIRAGHVYVARPNPVLGQREPAAPQIVEPVDLPQEPRTVRFRLATRGGGSRVASPGIRA